MSHVREKTLYCTRRIRTREGLKACFSDSTDDIAIYFGCLLLSLSLSWKIIQIYNLILLFKTRVFSYPGVSVIFLPTLDWESRNISFAAFKSNSRFDFALKKLRCNNSYFANPALTYALSASVHGQHSGKQN